MMNQLKNSSLQLFQSSKITSTQRTQRVIRKQSFHSNIKLSEENQKNVVNGIFNRSSLLEKRGRFSLKMISARLNWIQNTERVRQRGYSKGEWKREYSSGEKVVDEVPRSVAWWLFLCCAVVFGMVVLGGVTRLTESGLSMTDWHLVTGVIPPLTQEEWEAEFEKYKQYPEFKKLNSHMTLDEFKSIFYMEWSHRVLGRGIGFLFGIPFLYFLGRGFLNSSLKIKLGALFGLGGLQGLIGWWMVRSGLEEDIDIPRVSPYRLAVHLSSAFIIYLGLLWTGFSVMSPLKTIQAAPIPRTLRLGAGVVALMTFATAVTGAFVAGNDAGLVYNEFPFMGDGLVPDEYYDDEPLQVKFFERAETVQFNHRALAISTLAVITGYYMYARKFPLPKRARIALIHVFGMSLIQVSLGIATLLYFVPTPLAATHQAGSLTLLTFTTWLLYELKRIPIRIR
eukprot:TRINITY_DN2212_c0_g1_i1.p1 TRINITY_DN2212_c0_g1~~TRINITY_DN2212_c0_g1_i1.p1  ORF type:complete len:452 (-),score=89.23 TRINITY_DN2212_c0_g1_i1:31-1386(-)